MYKIAVVSLFLLLFNFVFSQESNEIPDLVTDRPDLTESSSVVPHKSLQLEAGFTFASSEEGTVKVSEIGYADALLRYGLMERMELRLGIGFAGVDMKDSGGGSGTEKLLGITPIKPGLKISIADEKGWMPELALLTHLHIPFKNSEITQTNISPDISLAASHTFSSRVSLGYNIGVVWFGDELHPNGTYSVAAGFGVAEKIGAFIETFGRFSNDVFTNTIDGGFTFLVLHNLQLDISGGIGLTDSAADYYIGAGFSFRLPR